MSSSKLTDYKFAMIIRKYYATLKILGSIWIYFETWEISMRYQGQGKVQNYNCFFNVDYGSSFFLPLTLILQDSSWYTHHSTYFERWFFSFKSDRTLNFYGRVSLEVKSSQSGAWCLSLKEDFSVLLLAGWAKNCRHTVDFVYVRYQQGC